MTAPPTIADLAPPGEPRAEAPTRARTVLRRLRADRPALAGVVLVLAMVLVAVAAPVLCGIEGQDPTTFHPELLDSARGGVPIGPWGGVSGAHWLGVEPGTGRDLFARAAYGARVSLGVAIAATLMQITVGMLVGMLAGLGGRLLDAGLTRLIDLVLALPYLVFAIALMAIVPADFPRPLLLTLVIAVLGWGGTARIVRGQALSLRTRDYVAAARLAGGRATRIARREIAPGLIAPVLTYTALLLPTDMVIEAGLSFLGVGVRPPTASWGQMLSTATTWFRADGMYVLVPGGLLFLSLLGFTLLADGVRGALDPRQRVRS